VSERYWLTPKLVVGLTIMAVGVVLALDNLDIIDGSMFLAWWPVGIVFFGVMKAFGVGTNRAPIAGLLFATLGTLLLLGSLDYMDISFGDLWPIALIAIGMTLVFRTVNRSKTVPVPAGAGVRGSVEGVEDDPADRTSAFAMMGGVTRRIVSERFKGGDLGAMMGGVELDLRSAKIAPGERAVFDTFVMWGGIDIRVPENWKVSSEAAVLLGAFEDKTRPFDGPPAGELVLNGFVLMGGIEVKN
jgi:hypothetical protein